MWQPAAVTLLFITGASARLLQDTADIHCQVEGGTEHDAPDACPLADPAFKAPIGQNVKGMLVPVDDEVDVYVMDVDASTIGTRLEVLAFPAVTASVDVSLIVHVPGCGSVTDPAHHPINATAPPAPAPGQKQVTPTNTGGTCSDRWQLINQVDPLRAPRSIHMRWTDGTTETVPLQKITPAGVAHYETRTDPGSTLYDVHANVDATWNGNFNFGDQICGGQQGDFATASGPDASQHTVEFTPVRTGAYVLEVRYAGLQEPPQQIPVSCHIGCAPGLNLLGDAEGYSLLPLSRA